jgi:hypothetical protein
MQGTRVSGKENARAHPQILPLHQERHSSSNPHQPISPYLQSTGSRRPMSLNSSNATETGNPEPQSSSRARVRPRDTSKDPEPFASALFSAINTILKERGTGNVHQCVPFDDNYHFGHIDCKAFPLPGDRAFAYANALYSLYENQSLRTNTTRFVSTCFFCFSQECDKDTSRRMATIRVGFAGSTLFSNLFCG